jgi:3-phosphoinositide dependent protein kinase-1
VKYNHTAATQMNADMFASFQDQEMERKGTFVGTVNYLAPEMIKECEATCASDLWALGCIIFKMYTGKVPFPGMSETACFPIILQRKIDWPKHMEMDPTVKDLIDQLIQLEPLDRLGCPMTGHDIKKLMRHPFFEGIDFKTNL